MSADVQVYGLHTAELWSCEIAGEVPGIEAFGIRIGFGVQDLIRKLSNALALKLSFFYSNRPRECLE